jgi:hypothetical protein
MLPLWEATVFDFVMKSFKNYFVSEKFIFAVRDFDDQIAFVKFHADSLGILDYQIIPIETPTRGQAHTAIIALEALSDLSDESILIFNVDTLRPGFKLPEISKEVGWLETFIAPGDHWSFVLPALSDADRVEKVSEKKRISEFCSTGAYWFANSNIFNQIYLQSRLEQLSLSEEYVAPLYEFLIRSGGLVAHTTIPATDLLACGTPSEYEHLVSNPSLRYRF